MVHEVNIKHSTLWLHNSFVATMFKTYIMVQNYWSSIITSMKLEVSLRCEDYRSRVIKDTCMIEANRDRSKQARFENEPYIIIITYSKS